MKKSRLLIITLSLVILICGIFGIVASADGEPSLEIARKNLSFENEPRLVFAVESVGITEEISVIYYEENPDLNPEASSKAAISLGIDKTLGLPIFALEGVNPKDVAKEFYVQAVSGNIKSDVFKYSVLEWVLEGTVKTSDPFFDTVLAYFSAVQDKVGYSGAHADTYKYITVTDGMINGFKTLITAEDTVEVVYTGTPATGYTQSGWKVTVDGVTETFSTNTITVSGNATISPNLVTLRMPLTEGETFEGATHENIFTSAQSGDIISITTDPVDATNRVLQCVDATTSSSSYLVVDSSTTDYSCNSIVVFETRLYIDKSASSSGYVAMLGFSNDKTARYSIYLQIDPSMDFAYLSGNNSYSAPSGVGKKDLNINTPNNRLTLDDWNVLRLEYHNTGVKSTSTLHIYINNEYVCEYNCTGSSVTSNVNAARWATYSGPVSTIYFDNMSCIEKPLN